MADLHADEEGEGHDDDGEAAILVVRWSREAEVEVGEKSGRVSEEEAAEGEDGSDEAVLKYMLVE